MTKYLVIGLIVMSTLSGGARANLRPPGKSQTEHPSGHDYEYATAR